MTVCLSQGSLEYKVSWVRKVSWVHLDHKVWSVLQELLVLLASLDLLEAQAVLVTADPLGRPDLKDLRALADLSDQPEQLDLPDFRVPPVTGALLEIKVLEDNLETTDHWDRRGRQDLKECKEGLEELDLLERLAGPVHKDSLARQDLSDRRVFQVLPDHRDLVVSLENGDRPDLWVCKEFEVALVLLVILDLLVVRDHRDHKVSDV